MKIYSNFYSIIPKPIIPNKQDNKTNFGLILTEDTGILALLYLKQIKGINNDKLRKELTISDEMLRKVYSKTKKLTGDQLTKIENLLGKELSLFTITPEISLEFLAQNLGIVLPVVKDAKLLKKGEFNLNSVVNRTSSLLSKYRATLGITKDEVAKLLGVGRSVITKKETNPTAFTAYDLYYYSSLLKKPLSWFEQFVAPAGKIIEKDFSDYKPEITVPLPNDILKSRIQQNFDLLRSKKDKTIEEIAALKTYKYANTIEAEDVFGLAKAFKTKPDFLYENPEYNKTLFETE